MVTVISAFAYEPIGGVYNLKLGQTFNVNQPGVKLVHPDNPETCDYYVDIKGSVWDSIVITVTPLTYKIVAIYAKKKVKGSEEECENEKRKYGYALRQKYGPGNKPELNKTFIEDNKGNEVSVGGFCSNFQPKKQNVKIIYQNPKGLTRVITERNEISRAKWYQVELKKYADVIQESKKIPMDSI